MKASRTTARRASACRLPTTTKKGLPPTRKTSRRTNRVGFLILRASGASDSKDEAYASRRALRALLSMRDCLLLGKDVVAPPEIDRRVSKREIAIEAARHPGSSGQPHLVAARAAAHRSGDGVG